MTTTGALALAAVFAVLAAGCASDGPPPPAHPGPYNTPAEAFEATPVPYDPSAGEGGDQPLSRDLSQLRDARENFEHSQAVQRSEAEDEQARCRADPNSHLVPIHDGTGDPNAVFCMSGPGQAPSDDSNDGDSSDTGNDNGP